MVIKGTTSGSISGTPLNIPCTLKSFYLTNNTGGSITVTLAIGDNLTGQSVKLFSKSIAANETESSSVEVKINSGSTVYISTSGSLDYYLTIL